MCLAFIPTYQGKAQRVGGSEGDGERSSHDYGMGSCEYKEVLCRSQVSQRISAKGTMRNGDLNNEQVLGLCSQGEGGGVGPQRMWEIFSCVTLAVLPE